MRIMARVVRPSLLQMLLVLVTLCASLTKVQGRVTLKMGKTTKIILAECEDATWISGFRTANLLSHVEGVYPAGRDCLVHLTVPDGYLVNITLQRVNLQPASPPGHQCVDYLQLYNGHGTQLQLSERLCAHHQPSSIISNQSQVTLRFKTDPRPKQPQGGFVLVYDRVHPDHLQDLGLLHDVMRGPYGTNQIVPEDHNQRPLTKPVSHQGRTSQPSTTHKKRVPFS